jgi:hypothetical protein
MGWGHVLTCLNHEQVAGTNLHCQLGNPVDRWLLPRLHQGSSRRRAAHGLCKVPLLTLVAHSIGHGSGTLA